MTRLLSVGIDIGTSTTQLIFSDIIVDNTTGYFAVPHISIVDKTLRYRSRVWMTPLLSNTIIDSDAIRDIVAQEYRDAGIEPEQVDTGAVIITGESARKENARAVMDSLSSFAGEFVVSTAGPDLESVIAGKGSGAWAYSINNHCKTVNLDIGGGTTNIVVFNDGDVVGKGCFDIGGRLIRLDENQTVTYISPAAQLVAGACGLSFEVGDRAEINQRTAITDTMAQLLAQAVGMGERSELLLGLQTPGSTRMDERIDRDTKVFFSGGVANCIAPNDAYLFPYGDIGLLLGHSIYTGTLYNSSQTRTSAETIRATVVGAGMFTTTVSGSTITFTATQFPFKNVPVLKLTPQQQQLCFNGDTEALREHIRWFCEQSSADQVMIALIGKPDPEYWEIKNLALCLADAMEVELPMDLPLLVSIEHDIAKAVGIIMQQRLKGRRDIVCLDSIKVEDGDYIDIGKPLFDGLVIPIVVKSLLFS